VEHWVEQQLVLPRVWQCHHFGGKVVSHDDDNRPRRRRLKKRVIPFAARTFRLRPFPALFDDDNYNDNDDEMLLQQLPGQQTDSQRCAVQSLTVLWGGR
jgi:hypothetical protein